MRAAEKLQVEINFVDTAVVGNAIFTGRSRRKTQYGDGCMGVTARDAKKDGCRSRENNSRRKHRLVNINSLLRDRECSV